MRLRRLLAAVLASLTLAAAPALLSGAPAAADSNPITLIGAHWPSYRWNGQVQQPLVRAFYLYDRSNDPDTWQMLNQMAWEWDTYYVQGNPNIPYIAVVQDYSHQDQCLPDGMSDANLSKNNPGPNLFADPTDAFSFALVCVHQLDGAFGSGVAGATYVGGGAPYSHAVHWVESIVLDWADGRSYELRKTALRHEFVHLLGFGHSTDYYSLMSPTLHPPASGIIGFQDVWPAISAFYNGHPRD